MWHRLAIHTVFLLLAACASNFLVLASPALDLEPRALARDPGSEYRLPKDIMGVHQPRELAKRVVTMTDRRLLNVGINQDVATKLSIPSSFPYRFEYYYDSVRDRVHYDIDVVGQATFTLDIGPVVSFGAYPDGKDFILPAVAKSVLDADRTLIVTFVWGVRMRVDSIKIAGMVEIDLLLNTTKGQTEIKAGEYSWTFEPTK